MHRYLLLSAQVFITECTGFHYWVHRYSLVNAQLFITECTGIHIQQRTSATGTCTWQTTASISWMKGTSPTLAVMSVTDTSGMMTCLSIHRCIINYLRKLLYAFINPSVLCRPLTQKQKTIQCSNLEEQLHMTWVTDRFILRSFLDNTAWPISSISSKISAVTYVCVEICVAWSGCWKRCGNTWTSWASVPRQSGTRSLTLSSKLFSGSHVFCTDDHFVYTDFVSSAARSLAATAAYSIGDQSVCVCLSLCVCLSVCLCLSLCLSVCLSDCLSVCLSLYYFVYTDFISSAARSLAATAAYSIGDQSLCVCLSVCLSLCLSLWLSVCLSVSLLLCLHWLC